MTVDAQISSSLGIAAATNAGSPVIVSDPDHQLSTAVRQLAITLAGELVGNLGAAEPSTPQSEADAKSRRTRRRK
jgi:pilus assembly protein CpaE